MSGTAKWLIVGSVVVMALATVVALSLFVWMIFRSPVMGSTDTGWGMPHMTLNNSQPWRDGFAGRHGMMDGSGYGGGMMGGSGYGGGMMGSQMFWVPRGSNANAEPITFEAVEERVEATLDGREDLAIAEIMIFDNHAYVEIIEANTGIGAMELLVDPQTLIVYPEHGPNMMWNTKYGMHGGGMMGFATQVGDMTVGAEEAVALAQAYLDRSTPGLKADDHAAEFYGYYTIHTVQDGQVVGMLSVNGYSGDVFPHTWHGALLNMREVEHDG